MTRREPAVQGGAGGSEAGAGAIFGIVGPCRHDAAERMAAALSHRGRRHDVTPLPSGGFVGAVGPARRTTVRASDRAIAASCGTRYDGPDGAGPLDPAIPFEAAAPALRDLDADFSAVSVGLPDGTIRLARDYFGCAPLYFGRVGGAVAFASEYKALLAVGVPATADRPMLQHLQHAKRLPPGRTLLGGVEAIPPGSVMTIQRDGGRRLQTPAPLKVEIDVEDPPTAIRLVREHLAAAVERRSADAGTIGIALSGGIDSIGLAFLVRALYPDRRIVTITSGSSPADPECRTAREVAGAIGSDHREVLVTADRLTRPELARLVLHLEDPYSRSETLQLFDVGRAAAEAGCDIVLAGQAADGLFAGMPRHRLLHAMSRLGPLRAAIGEFFTYTQLGVDPRSSVARAAKWLTFRGGVMPVPRIDGVSYEPAPLVLPPDGPQFLNRALAAGLQVSVCQDVQKFERGFAAHGAVVRCPYYDRRLVQAAYTIDDRLKIRRGQQKWVFRRALEEWVPDRFCRLAKFPQRMASDLGVADALDRLLDETGVSDRQRARPLFADGELARLRRPSPAHPYEYEGAMRIWTAVLTDLWAEVFDVAG